MSAIFRKSAEVTAIARESEGAAPGSRPRLPAFPSVAEDGRWSPVAAATVRGVCRMLARHGVATVTEMPFASGRRADIVALADDGTLTVIEVKSSLVDLRVDRKWPEYRAYCDRLYFAAPPDLSPEIFPEAAGLIVADAYGGEFLRHDPAERRLNAATRKTMLIRFGQMAARRFHRAADPEGGVDPLA